MSDPLTAPAALPPTGRSRDTLTGRLVLLGVLTALVSVVAVGLASVGLLRSVAQSQAQATLARQADVVARLAGSLPLQGEGDLVAALAALERQGVTARVVLAADRSPGQVVVQARRDGTASAVTGSPAELVEARRVTSDAVLVLRRPLSVAIDDVATPVLQRLGIALLIGLLVAIVAGALAARRLARPLRDAGEAARRLTTGERSVRVAPEGPIEVAEVAEALNGLADALQRSESRQRRFLLSVSHELRTPLTAVRGYAEALADGVVAGEDAARAGAVIAAEADRLDRLMTDLLALARAEADDFTIDVVEVDLTDLVSQAAQAWAEPARRAGLDLRLETTGARLPALADPVRLRQVVDALVGNAVRVTPAGQPIVLAALALADGRPILQVRDGGPGLTDDDLPVAFDQGVLRDRYQGLRPGGSGIGLALVDRLTRGMGGVPTAGHAAEGGAAFTIALARPPSTVPS